MVELLLLMSRILHCTYATLFRKEAACGLVTLQFSDQYIFHLAFSIHYMIFYLIVSYSFLDGFKVGEGIS